MKTRHIIGSMVLLLAGLGLSCNAVQPVPDCTVARGEFAARYTLKDGPATGACREKKGELLGLYKYNAAVDTPDGRKPDNSKATIAIQSQTLGRSPDQGRPLDPAHPLYSEGSFPVVPGADGMCVAASLSKAEQHVASSGIDIVYEWSNVRVLNKAEALGTQLGADLSYTEGGCTATYEVNAIWPAAECTTNADCTGGINPLFPVECSTDLGLCVLVGRVPQLKAQ